MTDEELRLATVNGTWLMWENKRIQPLSGAVFLVQVTGHYRQSEDNGATWHVNPYRAVGELLAWTDELRLATANELLSL